MIKNNNNNTNNRNNDHRNEKNTNLLFDAAYTQYMY